MKYSIYTDGSCRKTKKGGWAAVVVVENDLYDTLEGTDHPTTNNRMELQAIMASIKYLWKKEGVIYSDSRYCVDGIKSWMIDWHRNDWKNVMGDPIKNRDLWVQTHELVTSFSGNIKIKWVKAHSPNTGIHSSFNKLADFLAKEQSNESN